MERLPSEKTSGADNQQERIVEAARTRLRTAYTEREIEDILSDIKEGALEELQNVRTSTNPVQARKYLNAWHRKWRGGE